MLLANLANQKRKNHDEIVTRFIVYIWKFAALTFQYRTNRHGAMIFFETFDGHRDLRVRDLPDGRVGSSVLNGLKRGGNERGSLKFGTRMRLSSIYLSRARRLTVVSNAFKPFPVPLRLAPIGRRVLAPT